MTVDCIKDRVYRIDGVVYDFENMTVTKEVPK